MLHIPVFGPAVNSFDLNGLDPDKPPAAPFVMICHSKQIGWIFQKGEITSMVVLSQHAYFGNTVHSIHPIPVRNDQFVLVGDSLSCLQDLRHAATVGGRFHDNLPVYPAALMLEITDENRGKWTFPSVWVDASNIIKTEGGVRIKALFMTIGPDGEIEQHESRLDPAGVMCVSPFWEPEVAKNSPFRDQRILYASFFVAGAPDEKVSEHVKIFEVYWAGVNKAKQSKRFEHVTAKYKSLMLAARFDSCLHARAIKLIL